MTVKKNTDKYFIFVCVVLVFIAYSNTFNSPFYLDDNKSILKNEKIQIQELSVQSLKEASFESHISTRPLPYLSFAINYRLHQYSLFGYHLVNIIIHILNGILLFYIFKTILQSPKISIEDKSKVSWVSFSAAILWLVNPVQIQAVTYIVQRMVGLATLFYLLSLYLYLKSRSSRDVKMNIIWLSGCFISWILALCSKEIAWTLPVVLLIYEYCFARGPADSRARNNYLYPVAGLLVVGVVAVFFTGTSPLEFLESSYAIRDFSMQERLFTQFRVVCHYISLIFFPVPSRLSLEYDFPVSSSLFDPVTTILSAIALLVFISLPMYYGKRREITLFVVLWFFVNLLTESSLIGLEIIFEHRMYLPSAMLFLLVSFESYEFFRNKKVALSLLVIVVIGSSFLTFTRNAAWADPGYFWRDAFSKSPENYRVCYSYGLYLSETGNFEAALEMSKKAVQYNQDFVPSYVNVGTLYAMKGNHLEAIRWYEKVIPENPEELPDLYFNMSKAYRALGMHGKSRQAYQKYLLYK